MSRLLYFSKYFIYIAFQIFIFGCGGSLITAGDYNNLDDYYLIDESDFFSIDTESPQEFYEEVIDPFRELTDVLEDERGEDFLENITLSQCSDGVDNDGDELIDMDDFDCSDSTDPVEGPETGECTNDSHCNGGWDECNLVDNTCYDPPYGNICERCWSSSDCGDGVTGNNPDRDYCVYITYQGVCAKDCRNDFDCPRGFICDHTNPAGTCILHAGTCDNLNLYGYPCQSSNQCGGRGMECHDNICTSQCELQHDCPSRMNCVNGWCLPE